MRYFSRSLTDVAVDDMDDYDITYFITCYKYVKNLLRSDGKINSHFDREYPFGEKTPYEYVIPKLINIIKSENITYEYEKFKYFINYYDNSKFNSVYKYDIVYMDEEYLPLIQQLGSAVIIYPEKVDLPKWAQEFNFPDFGGDEEGRYICFDDDVNPLTYKSDYLHEKSLNVIVLIDTKDKVYKYNCLIGRTEH